MLSVCSNYEKVWSMVSLVSTVVRSGWLGACLLLVLTSVLLATTSSVVRSGWWLLRPR